MVERMGEAEERRGAQQRGQGPAEEAKLGTEMGRELGQPGVKGKGTQGREQYQMKDDGIGKGPLDWPTRDHR